jgi:hypothetical protein
MENFGIFYDHLEYFTAIWYYLWPFSKACGNLEYFRRFGMFGPRKIWQPCLTTVFIVRCYRGRKNVCFEGKSRVIGSNKKPMLQNYHRG